MSIEAYRPKPDGLLECRALMALSLVHPLGLPTLLPRGLIRVHLLEARRAVGCPIEIDGDCNQPPEHLSYRPVTTPERFLVIGHVAWDEIRKELAFNIVDGFFTDGGQAMVWKLSQRLFLSVPTLHLIEFNTDATEATIHAAKRITGIEASRLYRMLEHQVIRDKDRWRKVFPPDPAAKENKGEDHGIASKPGTAGQRLDHQRGSRPSSPRLS